MENLENLLIDHLVKEKGYDRDTIGAMPDGSYPGQLVLSAGSAVFSIGDYDTFFREVKETQDESFVYYNPEFLASETELPMSVFIALGKCESRESAEAVKELVEETCGIDNFFEDAIQEDGFGGILYSYDGVTEEIGDYYVIRWE